MQQKLVKLINALSEDLVERKDVIQLSLLTMIVGENLILIGPPGTAKSEIKIKGISKNPNKLRVLPRGEIVQNFF